LQQHQYVDTSCFLDENNLGTSWEPLWTWWSTMPITYALKMGQAWDIEKHTH
jgi:hypothetical protein